MPLTIDTCRRHLTAAGVALVLGVTVAHANPVTYSGTLGKTAIVVEFSGDPAASDRPLAGRYFYRDKGIDIPLQAGDRETGAMSLTEEAICDIEKCPDGTLPEMAATWSLRIGDGGKTLTGTWLGARSHPIVLGRIGERPDEEGATDTPYALFSVSESLSWQERPIDMATAPYDFLRLQGPLTKGEKTVWGDVAFDTVTDPRTVFAYPRIVSLGGEPIETANAVLQQRHWAMSSAALSCYAQQYYAFHDPETPRPYAGGSLAGYEDSTTSVSYLSKTLMSWQETSSIFCGGAHPANNSSSFTMDVRTGKLLSAGDIFTGWADQPPAALIDFVKTHRTKPTGEGDLAFEQDCGMDDLIASSLSSRFNHSDAGDEVVFSVEGLPHAIFVCTGDLLTVPVADVKAFLTPLAISLLPD